MDINLVDFEIIRRDLVVEKVVKITQLLRAPQTILFQCLYGTGEILFSARERVLGVQSSVSNDQHKTANFPF